MAIIIDCSKSWTRDAPTRARPHASPHARPRRALQRPHGNSSRPPRLPDALALPRSPLPAGQHAHTGVPSCSNIPRSRIPYLVKYCSHCPVHWLEYLGHSEVCLFVAPAAPSHGGTCLALATPSHGRYTCLAPATPSHGGYLPPSVPRHSSNRGRQFLQ